MVEETGCDKDEARHYLEEASGNITWALKNILRDIKPIGVIKCRFKIDEVNIYGLVLFIFNGRTRKMFRYAAVVGCNPVIYETDNRQQWFLFEKELYSQRLKDGSLREITQKIEQSLLVKIQEQDNDEYYNSWDELNIRKIEEIFKDQIREVIKYDTGKEYDANIEIQWQKLNLRQFKYLTDTEKIDEEFKLHLDEERTSASLIALNTELVKSTDGSPTIKIEKVEAGDMVFTEISDDRDIGIYLAHLLGARKEDLSIPLSASVEDVKDTEEGVEIIVRFGPGIVGRAIENPKKKIGIIRNPIARTCSWWYLVVAFAAATGYYVIFVK